MNEAGVVLDAWQRAEEARASGVLCTVVQVKGSAYRRPGARMLFFPDGRRYGSISGGCLEGDVCRKGWWLTSEGATLRTYDTTSDDDAVWEFGLGCNGVVHVLLERAGARGVHDSMQFLADCRRSRATGAIATVIRADASCGVGPGDRLCLRDGVPAGGSLSKSAFAKELRPWLELALHERRSRNVQIDDVDLFVELIEPPMQLFVFGAGHDAVPLVRMADELGWEVTVADGRPAWAKKERFPEACQVALLDSECDLSRLGLTPASVVVLITHNYPQDEKLLRRILPLEPRYLGLLGPRKRAERLLEDIGAEANARSIHAPIGLDIGADDPAAIALSIVSEIQAHLAGRPGSRLRSRKGPIHVRDGEAAPELFRPVRVCGF